METPDASVESIFDEAGVITVDTTCRRCGYNLRGLREDGLLEGRYDWNVYWTDISPEVCRSDEFRGRLQSWRRAVEEYADQGDVGARTLAPAELRLGQVLQALTLPQLVAVITWFVGLLVAAATIGWRVGANQWPWQ